ncbi:hypothetical protein CsSME_00029642 [Camellia sinensis var. sinensis]
MVILLLQHKLSSSDGSVEKIKLFNSKELEKATYPYNEHHILGTVYKGMLSNGRIIAVKKSEVVDEGKVEQFINEEFTLSWEMRFRIATEVAGALSYSLYAAFIPIYHRDMKSTNIFLDEKYKGKFSNFGTSTSIDVDNTHLTIRVQGTFGYLDLEYFQSSQFTDKSDLLTGQKPISSTKTQESRSLVSYFMQSIEENRLLQILGPRILQEGRREEMIVVAYC